MLKKVWLSPAAGLLFGCLTVMSHPQKPPGQSRGGQAGSNEAPKFLGSYSAPSAIATTEIGHVGAHSPSPPAGLRRLESLAESPPVLYQRVRAALKLSELASSRARISALFNADLYAIRAFAAEEEGDEPAAERECREGLTESPESAPLHAGLGYLFRQQRLLDLARDELAKAVALDLTDPVCAFELGDVFQRQGDQVHATALLESAAPADNSGELQWQLARLYRNMGRDDLAQKAQERSEQQRQQLKVK